ncbi:hypothetical protein VNO78_21231 [Psophocarpus tetragonolobus]|uniref:Uncharacterized protein n=1 Tax=Psophocarpus tetragonolobus TaxID=3891 RepID=A0AAN9XI70_PSOTE
MFTPECEETATYLSSFKCSLHSHCKAMRSLCKSARALVVERVMMILQTKVTNNKIGDIPLMLSLSLMECPNDDRLKDETLEYLISRLQATIVNGLSSILWGHAKVDPLQPS